MSEKEGAASAASLSSTDIDSGADEERNLPQRMKRGMSVSLARTPTGVEIPAYEKESKTARKERLEQEAEAERRRQQQWQQQQQQHQQTVVGATDPVHGVPQWAWDPNENGVEGAKMFPPNPGQRIALLAIMAAIKGGLGLPPGEATKDLWDHYGPYTVEMMWDPTIAHPVDLWWRGGNARYEPGSLSQWFGDPMDGRGHRALTPSGPNEGNWQQVSPPFEHVMRSHAWDSVEIAWNAYNAGQGNPMNEGFDIGNGDGFPPLPTTPHPVMMGQSRGGGGGGDAIPERERGAHRGNDKGKEKAKAKPKEPPVWVGRMKAMHSDTARVEENLGITPWERALLPAEGERDTDGVVGDQKRTWGGGGS